MPSFSPIMIGIDGFPQSVVDFKLVKRGDGELNLPIRAHINNVQNPRPNLI
jgi:hypothetical protein